MAPFLFSDPGRVGAEPLSPANPSICQPIPSEQLISGRSSGRRLEPRPECQRPPRGSLTRATLERRGRGRSGAERGDRGAASAEEQGIKARLSRPPPSLGRASTRAAGCGRDGRPSRLLPESLFHLCLTCAPLLFALWVLLSVLAPFCISLQCVLSVCCNTSVSLSVVVFYLVHWFVGKCRCIFHISLSLAYAACKDVIFFSKRKPPFLIKRTFLLIGETAPPLASQDPASYREQPCSRFKCSFPFKMPRLSIV